MTNDALNNDDAKNSCQLSMMLASSQNRKLVRQQDAYLAIRPAYPRGCCPRAAKGDTTYLQRVFLHR